MLSSINFLFLVSLGFISWTILCYIQQIEEYAHLKTNIPKELPKEEITITTQPTSPPQVSKHSTSSDNNNYGSYANFLGIFVCIYALVKVTGFVEVYMAKRIRQKIYVPLMKGADMETSETINDLQDEQENLKCKINKLEKQNHEIKLKLKNVVENRSDTPTDLEEKIQNIFITNKNIHINRRIYINKDCTFNKEFEKENKQAPTSVWEKCMELKNSTSHKSNAKISYMPVIMSREELENIKSIL